MEFNDIIYEIMSLIEKNNSQNLQAYHTIFYIIHTFVYF